MDRLWIAIAFACLAHAATSAEDSILAGLDRGVSFLEKRLADDPDDFVAANQLVERLQRRARWSGRLDDLRRAEEVTAHSLKVAPPERNTGGLTARAQVLSALHRFKESADLARELEKLLPGKAAPQAILGEALLELGDLEGAEKAFAEALRRSTRDYDSEFRALRVAWQRGDLTAAERHLEAVLALTSSDVAEVRAWALLQRGEYAFRRGDWAAADEHYLAAEKLAPSHWSVREHLAELRAAQGRDAEAVELFTAAAKQTNRPELWQALGDFHLFQKRPAEAKAAHDRALAGYRASLERGEVLYVHHLAGFYCDSQEDAAEAVKQARRDLELRQSSGAWDALAWALYKQGDLPAARDAARKALANGLRDAHVLYHAAMIAMSTGEIAEGQRLLRECAQVNPHFAAFHVHR